MGSTPKEGSVCYFDRRQQKMVTETVLGDSLLRLAYVSPLRGILRWPLFGTGLLSRLTGAYANSGFSRRKIAPTISQLSIRMEEFVVPEGGYRCFNDFFCRKLQAGARDFSGGPEIFHSPADCRLLVFPEFTEDEVFAVKGTNYSVSDLLGVPGKEYQRDFRGGSLCICRLCPADYHRYHFPVSGQYRSSWRLRGKYHSVNPLALASGLPVFTGNVRRVAILDLDKFGRAAYIEVGAFGVASINETFRGDRFQAGEEKGYFTFGGSTVIMVFQPKAIEFDSDIVENSRRGIETRVLAGDRLGCLKA